MLPSSGWIRAAAVGRIPGSSLVGVKPVKHVHVAGLLLTGMAALVVSPVFAQSLPMELSSTVLNSFDSGGCKTTAATPCSESYEYAANPGNLTDVTASPTTYSVSDTFNQSGSLSTLSDFGSSVYTPETSPHCTAGAPGNCLNSSPFQTWNFQDNYEFQTPGSGPQLQGAVLSFSLPGNMTGLSDLEARVIAVPRFVVRRQVRRVIPERSLSLQSRCRRIWRS